MDECMNKCDYTNEMHRQQSYLSAERERKREGARDGEREMGRERKRWRERFQLKLTE